MNNLLKFIQKYSSFFMLLGFQIVCFSFLFSNVNSYHHLSFANSSNVIAGGIYEASSNVSNYFHLEEENKQLRNQNRQLKKELKGHEIKIGELFTRVDDTLYLQQYDFLDAKIISSSKNSRKNNITINKGTENNIDAGMGVIGPNGIIGVTTSSSSYYTSVKPIIHEDFILEIIHEKSNSFGFVKWVSTDTWKTATVVDVPNYVTVKKGDKIVTRGSNGLFPTGELVGYVDSFKEVPGEVYLEIKINLAEDFSNIYTVQVVKNILKKELNDLKENQN